MLDWELLYTKILEVHLFAFAYRLFHEDFSPFDGDLHEMMVYFTIKLCTSYIQPLSCNHSWLTFQCRLHPCISPSKCQ